MDYVTIIKNGIIQPKLFFEEDSTRNRMEALLFPLQQGEKMLVIRLVKAKRIFRNYIVLEKNNKLSPKIFIVYNDTLGQTYARSITLDPEEKLVHADIKIVKRL